MFSFLSSGGERNGERERKRRRETAAERREVVREIWRDNETERKTLPLFFIQKTR